MIYMSQGSMDLDQLTDLIKVTLDKVWGPGWGIFSDNDPTGNDPETTPMPHITYNLVSRVPVKEHGMARRLYDQLPDSEYPGHYISIYRQWFKCDVEFIIYARTRREATVTAFNFEEFMADYIGFFKHMGVNQIFFEHEESPDVSSQYRQDIPHRTVRYSVKIERNSTVRSGILKQVELEIVGTELADAIVEEEQQAPPVNNNDFIALYDQHFPK